MSVCHCIANDTKSIQQIKQCLWVISTTPSPFMIFLYMFVKLSPEKPHGVVGLPESFVQTDLINWYHSGMFELSSDSCFPQEGEARPHPKVIASVCESFTATSRMQIRVASKPDFTNSTSRM